MRTLDEVVRRYFLWRQRGFRPANAMFAAQNWELPLLVLPLDNHRVSP